MDCVCEEQGWRKARERMRPWPLSAHVQPRSGINPVPTAPTAAEVSFSDLNLYSAIHQVLEAERASDSAERRIGRRHAYRCVQLIAPILGGRLPNQSQFRLAQCEDLSCGGLAYLSDEFAEGEELIVALGTVPFMFIKARVLRQDRVARGGQSIYRVACQFVSRIVERPAAAGSAADSLAG